MSNRVQKLVSDNPVQSSVQVLNLPQPGSAQLTTTKNFTEHLQV